MSAFVGTRTVASAEELRSLIEDLQTSKSCFFLQWPHKVSGLCRTLLTDFPSPKGQMFDSQKELRWKQQGRGYSVLLLHADGTHPSFKPVGNTWQVHVQDTHLYPRTETRFPKGINDLQINISQCYFADSQTAIIHFVALITGKNHA